MEKVEVIVVGAGVVGLAIARAEALLSREVILLEQENDFGLGVSSRNSEVMHAGIFYPPNSLKAQLCVKGRLLLQTYCGEKNIAHQRCGKLVVITNKKHEKILQLVEQAAKANGVSGDDQLIALTSKEANDLEPALDCKAALLSPATGIIDSHGLMLSLLADAQVAGAEIAFNSPFVTSRVIDSGFEVTTGDSNPYTIGCRRLINASGLNAQSVASRMIGYPQQRIPTPIWTKGTYFQFNSASPFKRLIYPLSGNDFSVHVTHDLNGQARFGPDSETVKNLDYSLDPSRIVQFESAIRSYWPDLPSESLSPSYAGIRPQISKNNGFADFIIESYHNHGIKGLVQLYGIESPGLTASMAIGEYVANI